MVYNFIVTLNISHGMTITRPLPGLLMGLLLTMFVGVEAAEEKSKSGLRFQVDLVWGTNDEKSNDPALKEISPELREELKKTFVWKYYHQVNSQALAIPNAAEKKLKLSKKCEIVARDLGKSIIEVKLFGEGNLVTTVKQRVTPGNYLVLAGPAEDKSDTSWFVALKRK